MNFRLTWVLFAIAVLAVGGFLVAVLIDDRPAPNAILLEPLAFSKEEDIDTLVLVRQTETGDEKLVLTRGSGPGQWNFAEPMTARADSLPVSGIITALLKLKPTEYPALSTSLTTQGLDKPGMSITLKSGERKSATLNIGDTTIGKERAVTFVTTGTRPSVPVAVRRADLDAVFRIGSTDGKSNQLARWVSDFRQKRVLGGDLRDPVTDLASLSIRQGSKTISLAHTSPSEWIFTQPANYGVADVAGDPAPKPETFTGVRPLLNALAGLTVLNPTDFLENPGDLAEFGLKADDPNVIVVEFVPKEGKPERLLIGKRVDEKAAEVGGKYFMKVEGDPAVMKISADRVPALARIVADPFDLRDRTLVSDLKKGSIDALDLTVGTDTLKARRVTISGAPQWVLYGGPTDPQVAGPAVQDLINLLTKPRAAREVLTAPNDAAFADAERKSIVKLWFDGVAPVADPGAGKVPPEVKVNGAPSVVLTFGKREGDAVFVRRTAADGTNTDLKLADDVLLLAARDRLGFLEPRFQSFASNLVTKLAFNRGAEAFELDVDNDGKWTFAQPERVKGKLADSEKLTKLAAAVATMAPNRVIAENPSDADLSKFGLGANARMKLTVSLKDNPEKPSFEFGNDTDDKTSVYARQAGKNLVVIVPKVILDRFVTADLSDPTLYRLQKDQIKAVQLKGWKQLFGSPAEYRFEKKADTWTTTLAPPGFVVDPIKLDALLDTVLSPRSEAFVNGGPKPEQGVDLATGANTLVIQLERDGQPPVVLTLGNDADGGANFYCTTSTVPGAVFTVSTLPYRTYREKPATLQK